MGRRRPATISGPAACPRVRSQVRVKAGRLHPLYRGVYAVGHPTISLRGRCLAAVKACGPRRRPLPLRRGVPLGHARPVHALPRRHRAEGQNATRGSTRTKRQRRRSTLLGIPVTTPLQTIIHLSAVAPVQHAAPRGQRSPQPRPHHPESSSPPTTAARRSSGTSSPPPLRPAARTRTSSCTSSTKPASQRPRSTRRSPARTSSPTSSGPTTTSSSRPTASASTASCSSAPTTPSSTTVFEALGYTVIRTSWAEATSRPDRMLAPRSARADARRAAGRVEVEVGVDGEQPPRGLHPEPGRLQPVARRCPTTRRRPAPARRTAPSGPRRATNTPSGSPCPSPPGVSRSQPTATPSPSRISDPIEPDESSACGGPDTSRTGRRSRPSAPTRRARPAPSTPPRAVRPRRRSPRSARAGTRRCSPRPARLRGARPVGADRA